MGSYDANSEKGIERVVRGFKFADWIICPFPYFTHILFQHVLLVQ